MKKYFLFVSFACLALLILGLAFVCGCGTGASSDHGPSPITFIGTWEGLADLPSSANDGGSLAGDGTRYLYATIGGNSDKFYRYDAVENTWEALTSPPGNVAEGCCLVYYNNKVYGLRGNGTSDFAAYVITGDSWTTEASLPVTDSYGTACYANGYIFAYTHDSGTTTTFSRYSPSADTWEVMADAPYSCYWGSSMVWDRGNYIYMRNGNGNNYFWRYNISGNTHEVTIADYPVGHEIRYTGNALTYPTGSKIYSLKGNDEGTFEAYNIGSDAWETLAPVPSAAGHGASLIWNGGSYLYAICGDDDMKFYRYK